MKGGGGGSEGDDGARGAAARVCGLRSSFFCGGTSSSLSVLQPESLSWVGQAFDGHMGRGDCRARSRILKLNPELLAGLPGSSSASAPGGEPGGEPGGAPGGEPGGAPLVAFSRLPLAISAMRPIAAIGRGRQQDLEVKVLCWNLSVSSTEAVKERYFSLFLKEKIHQKIRGRPS